MKAGMKPIPAWVPFGQVPEYEQGSNQPKRAEFERDVWRNQLERQFGMPPDGARFAVKGFDVVVEHRTSSVEHARFIAKVEAEKAVVWDKVSIATLKTWNS